MAEKLTPARRVASVAELEAEGDYCGPLSGFTGDKPAVFFILPGEQARSSTWPHGRIGHVTIPPHTFRECGDGSLELRASIGHRGDQAEGYAWHGYLDEGNTWREV